MAALEAAALFGALGPVAQDLSGETVLVDELRRQCAELEHALQQDPLTFENEALSVQLLQMQDDYSSLLDDFRGARDYFGQQIAEFTAQLEGQTRAAGIADGHADCLGDLLQFHEDQGKLAGSYWRAQCEKRDDSIRFLALKLQEFTVPSSEYQARRQAAAVETSGEKATPATATPGSTPQQPSSRSQTSSPQTGSPRERRVEAVLPPPLLAPSNDIQSLMDRHMDLCREVREQAEQSKRVESELKACELSCAALRPSSVDCSSPPSEDEAEREQLRSEVAACEQALGDAEVEALPPWALRCEWRAELDVRAGQLERISKQFDTTKRSLDAVNDELHWQATSADALRMRLAEVMRTMKSEETKAQEFRFEQQQSESAIQEMLEQWPSSGGAQPLACQQARWLLERFQRGQAREEGSAPASASPVLAPRAVVASGLPAGAFATEARPASQPSPALMPSPADALAAPLPPVLTWSTVGFLGT